MFDKSKSNPCAASAPTRAKTQWTKARLRHQPSLKAGRRQAAPARRAAAGGMTVDAVEAEGRTVNEATEKAIESLGLRRDQVDVEVLSEGRPRLLGFRGEPARVRVTPRPAPAPVTRAPVASIVDEDEADYDDEDEYED